MVYFIEVDADGLITGSYASEELDTNYIEVTKIEYDIINVGTSGYVNGTIIPSINQHQNRDISLWRRAREVRDNYLQKTDWTQLPDARITPDKKTLWLAYRQALRDITLQPDPSNITWPTPPV